jgi:hypothetical protein
MAKYKSELNKKISAIISGFLISRNNDTEQSPSISEKEIQNNLSPQQSVPKQPLSPSLSPQQAANPSAGAVVSKQPPAAGSAVKSSGQISQGQRGKQIKNKLSSAKSGVDSNKNKKMAIVMGVLLLVFIFVIVRTTKQLSPNTATASNSAKANVGRGTGIAEKNINWQMPEVYPSTLRDPMQLNLLPAGQEDSNSSSRSLPIVKGIMCSVDRPSAVIDDKIVHQGEKVSGATVVKINKNSVEFEMDGKKWTQEVKQ